MAMMRYRPLGFLLAATVLSGCCEAAYGPGKCIEMNKQHQAMLHLLPHTPLNAMPASPPEQPQMSRVPEGAIRHYRDAETLDTPALEQTALPPVGQIGTPAETDRLTQHAREVQKLTLEPASLEKGELATKEVMTLPEFSETTEKQLVAHPFKKAPSVEVIEVKDTQKNTSAGDTADWLRY